MLNFLKLRKAKIYYFNDAVNTELFINKKTKIYKNTCAYFGSLTKEGLEIILEISKLNKKINFIFMEFKNYV